MATKPNPFAKKMPPMKKGPSKSKDPDMAAEMTRCMKKKGMTRSQCQKMMGG